MAVKKISFETFKNSLSLLPYTIYMLEVIPLLKTPYQQQSSTISLQFDSHKLKLQLESIEFNSIQIKSNQTSCF